MFFFFFQAEDGIRDDLVTGVQTCALPISSFSVSQPNALGGGQTEVVPQTKLTASEAPARNIELSEGASVEQLVTRLQAIGATARDVVSILQAIKAAGALEADLEVI